MSIARLLFAAVFAFATGAAAHEAPRKAHHKRAYVHAQPAPKDPYANYWNDPSRQGFPSWGLTDVK
jgi:hypothetical protein